MQFIYFRFSIIEKFEIYFIEESKIRAAKALLSLVWTFRIPAGVICVHKEREYFNKTVILLF